MSGWTQRLDERGQGDQQAVLENSKYFALQKRRKKMVLVKQKEKDI